VIGALIVLFGLAACSVVAAGQTAVQYVWLKDLRARTSLPPFALQACSAIVKVGFASNATGLLLGLAIVFAGLAGIGRTNLDAAFAGNAVAIALFLLGLPWFIFCTVRWPKTK
jgi:hypothetical protein